MTPAEPDSVSSLDRTLAGGLAWAAGAKSATQFFTWAFTLLTAHLLTPADFGLVNMAGYVNVLTGSLAEFGMGQAVLQMPELEAGTIAQLNTAPTPKLAVDLPSGLDCDTGQPSRHTIRADETCTFVTAKAGFFAPAAAGYVGRLHVLDIGVPRKLIERIAAETGGEPR